MRFDVHEINGSYVPFAVDVQADVLSHLATTVIIPLIAESQAKSEVSARFKPTIVVNQEHYVLLTSDITSVLRRELGPVVDNIEAGHRQDITDALDFLYQGY